MTTDYTSEDFATSRVLVTGGTGFLGGYLLRELVLKGYGVKAIRRSSRPTSSSTIPSSVLDQVEWVEGDLLDPVSLEKAMEDVQSVIHAGAKVSFAPSDQDALYKINIEGTANVVNAALEKGIKRMVYVSSVAALGRSPSGQTIDEGKLWDEIRLDTNYAKSKYHAEMEVWRSIGEGLDAVIVNPSTILGYGDWNQTSCAIFKSVYQEFPWYSNGVTGFVSVEDVARACVLLLASSIKSERFILSAGDLSFRELFNMIADAFSKKHPWLEGSSFLAAIGWRIEWVKSRITGKPALLTKESARLASGHTKFDNQKILKFLPNFRFTPLEETVNRCCSAYLAHLDPQS
jgi:dihydroflavonol-4-reductase